MRFLGVRLLEQTEEKFRRFEKVLKKRKEKKQTSSCNSRALLLIKAPTKKTHFAKKKTGETLSSWNFVTLSHEQLVRILGVLCDMIIHTAQRHNELNAIQKQAQKCCPFCSFLHHF